MKRSLYVRIRDAFFWSIIIGLTGALLGGLAIGLVISGHLGWATVGLILCIGLMMWGDRFYQKGMGLLWEEMGAAFLAEKYPAGKSSGKGCS